MTSLLDTYTILRNCWQWHIEKIDIVPEEHEKRRHRHEAKVLNDKIKIVEKQLGLR